MQPCAIEAKADRVRTDLPRHRRREGDRIDPQTWRADGLARRGPGSPRAWLAEAWLADSPTRIDDAPEIRLHELLP